MAKRKVNNSTNAKPKLVKDSTKGKTNIKENSVPIINSDVKISLYYSEWLKSTKDKNINNFLKNEAEFSRVIFEMLFTFFPKVEKEWSEIIKSLSKRDYMHCHLETDAKVHAFIKKLHSNKEVDYEKIYQIGFKQGLRCYFFHSHTSNVLFPLFIDYHHTCYKSDKHNDNNVKTNGFCPVCYYGKVKRQK